MRSEFRRRDGAGPGGMRKPLGEDFRRGIRAAAEHRTEDLWTGAGDQKLIQHAVPNGSGGF